MQTTNQLHNRQEKRTFPNPIHNLRASNQQHPSRLRKRPQALVVKLSSGKGRGRIIQSHFEGKHIDSSKNKKLQKNVLTVSFDRSINMRPNLIKCTKYPWHYRSAAEPECRAVGKSAKNCVLVRAREDCDTTNNSTGDISLPQKQT